MKKHASIHTAISVVLFSTIICSTLHAADPLPSWNEGAAKSSIIKFVKSVTTPGGKDFIAVADRIATFDNDGTLWSEQPIYFQLFYAIDRVKALAPQHPEWKNQQPFKAVLENDREALLAAGEKGILELVIATHTGMTTTEFDKTVKDWITTAKHPQLKRPYTDLVYQPMLELLDYLRTNGFKTFIVSGGGIDFMRAWVESVYGIPPEQVVGTVMKTEFKILNGIPTLIKLPEIAFVDDKMGKPVGIHTFIGKRPIAAFGNSDGDLQMLQWTTGNKPSFACYLHHTDADREWAYDKGSHIGGLEKGLIEANANNWTVIDMKKDWKVIYPFQKK